MPGPPEPPPKPEQQTINLLSYGVGTTFEWGLFISGRIKGVDIKYTDRSFSPKVGTSWPLRGKEMLF